MQATCTHSMSSVQSMNCKPDNLNVKCTATTNCRYERAMLLLRHSEKPELFICGSIPISFICISSEEPPGLP